MDSHPITDKSEDLDVKHHSQEIPTSHEENTEKFPEPLNSTPDSSEEKLPKPNDKTENNEISNEDQPLLAGKNIECSKDNKNEEDFKALVYAIECGVDSSADKKEEIIKEYCANIIKQQITKIRASIGTDLPEKDPNILGEEEFLSKFSKDSWLLKNIFGLEKPEENGHYIPKKEKKEIVSNELLEEVFKDNIAEEDNNLSTEGSGKILDNNQDAEGDDPENNDNPQDDEDDPFENEEEERRNNYKDDLKRILCSSLSREDDEEDNKITDQMQEYSKNKEDLLEEDLKQKNNTKYSKNSDSEEEEDEKLEEEEEEKGPFMSISNDSLSYERFYPGRILGNTFQVTNKGRKKITVSIVFTTEELNKKFAWERLLDFYEVSKIEEIEEPYHSLLNKPFIDSQKEYDCWFIEDPKSKSLVKEATLDLLSGESYEFIIVLKSPIIKKPKFLITNVKIINETYEEEQLVLAFGSLDVPKLICPKEIMDEENKYASVKVVMKKKISTQIFRFLLINKGDMPVVVNFSSLENDENLKFFIKSPNMHLDGGQRTILEVRANHKYKNITDDKWVSMNTHKLIIGKIKDCELKFSLIVDVIIIN